MSGALFGFIVNCIKYPRKRDLVLAKSIARFARNVVDCLSVIKELKEVGVGVRFDENNLYTMDATGSLVLTILATVAEEESRSKSFIMNWSIERRFIKGIFLTPELLGYDLDEKGNLVVNPEEAETVKVIYYLYINGWTHSEIADLLTEYGRKTKPGNEIWHPSSVDGIIENERHCGDVLARKTYTPDFQTHKSVKNRGEMKQIYYPDHHEAIVSRTVFEEANRIKASRTYHKKGKSLPVLSVIDSGVLKGFVPIDKDWKGFSAEEYQAASQSAYEEAAESAEQENRTRRGVNMTGYQSIRGEFFPSLSAPAMTITRGRMRFNTACLKKFEDVEYVELLINTVKNSIAIRPSTQDSPNAIHWGTLRENRWCVNEIGFKGFASVLFGMMSWDDDTRYKFRGQFVNKGEEKMLLFELTEPEMVKTVEQIVPVQQQDDASSDDAQEEIVVTEKVRVLPPSWENSFGAPITSLASVSLLERMRLDDHWDVLRPARELEELNPLTAEERSKFLHEAEEIIDGWSRQMNAAEEERAIKETGEEIETDGKQE